MSVGSTKFTVSRIAAFSLVSLWLVGCTNTDSPPAPASSAGGAISSSTNPGMLITLPSSGVKPAPQAQPIQPVQTQTIQLQPTSMAQKPVQTVNGKIVYNRKYGDIPKDSYTGGSACTVRRGDTLLYIVWVTGNDFRDLAQCNNAPALYALSVGQMLQVGNASDQPITGENVVSQASARASGGATATTTSAQRSTAVVASQPTIMYFGSLGEQSATKMLPNNKPAITIITVVAPVTVPITVSTTQPVVSSTSTSPPISSWCRPTDGEAIENFSGAEGGSKGIDVAGSKGQAIVVIADGRVVYVGNVLRGYGNPITIKYNNDYLNAYAHNDTMLVREQQEAKVGQKTVTMGGTGISSTRLHFEIRYKGRSVDPLQYLPQ